MANWQKMTYLEKNDRSITNNYYALYDTHDFELCVGTFNTLHEVVEFLGNTNRDYAGVRRAVCYNTLLCDENNVPRYEIVKHVKDAETRKLDFVELLERCEPYRKRNKHISALCDRLHAYAYGNGTCDREDSYLRRQYHRVNGRYIKPLLAT